jgi:RNA polymerase sigma-70 factor, ECF subfamily
MRSQRRQHARIVQGLELDDLSALPAANDAAAERSDVELAGRERDAKVREALAELPQDYRDVVVAHYHLDLGLQEIADRFDLTESAVRSRLHRARTRLRGILEGTPIAMEAIEEARRPFAVETSRQVAVARPTEQHAAVARPAEQHAAA